MPWEYTGIVEIERLGLRQGEMMQLPVCFTSEGSDPLMSENLINEAFAKAMEYIGWLADTRPATKDDYGRPTNFIPGSAIFI